MLDLKFVRNNIDLLKEKLLQRGSDLSLDEFIAVDGERRKIIQDVEDLRNRRNFVSKEVGRLKKEGQKAEHLMEETRVVKDRIKEMETVLEEKESALSAIILSVPNIPHPGVPIGKDSSDNPVAKRWGDIRQFDFEPRSHWDIGEELGILDFERGAKISGARFTLYKGLGAQLERALINFMLDLHASRHHYTEVWPPFIVNDTSMTATGQLPKFKEDLFKLEGRDYYLIPTAEVPVTNIHRDEVLEEKELPKRYVAYSACFRAEAGSYGKDTRGLIRQHQFNKVELVKFTTPETSYLELENLLLDAEEVLQQLGLPYQVVELCTGDLGFSAAKTYDIEVWLPGQGTFREISSCSNFEDFQARRANIRFRRSGKTKTELVHTLNGSGVAIGRTVVAILENYQQTDGGVVIPPVLRPYLMGKARIEKSA
ncbi:MAG: serine--tRNA ligase [Thermodesulfobacteriota bacterium]|nr:serine--tRNA ligase [Thermodesulfobacteriota bacterium]